MARTKKRTIAAGKWVFVPAKKAETPSDIDPTTAEAQLEAKKDFVMTMLSAHGTLNSRMEHRFAAVDQYHDYFPSEGNTVPETGAWILVKKSPPTRYTVPPLSIWFATPWDMESEAIASPVRVKIITPKGELGVFPREYSIVSDMRRYYEYLGKGMTIRFFGGDLSGVPEQQLFYLRSRGISKADALCLLIGNIKAHGIFWIETDREVAQAFVRDNEWPDESRLATLETKQELSNDDGRDPGSDVEGGEVAAPLSGGTGGKQSRVRRRAKDE